jgi:hypothetical protein
MPGLNQKPLDTGRGTGKNESMSRRLQMIWTSTAAKVTQRVLGPGLLVGATLLTLQTFGFFKVDANERFIERHYRLCQMERFLHLARRDLPRVHHAVALVCGNTWDQRFCVGAYKQRELYEKRLERRHYQLRHRSAQSPEFERRWARLNLPGYSRFTADRMNVRVFVLARDLPRVEALLADYDRGDLTDAR